MMIDDEALLNYVMETLKFSLDTKLATSDPQEWRGLIHEFIHHLDFSLDQWPVEIEPFDAFCRKLTTHARNRADFLSIYVEKSPSRFDSGTDPPNMGCLWPYCHSEKEHLERDHIIPKSHFGSDAPWISNRSQNMMWLCKYHNQMKTSSLGLGIMFWLVKTIQR